MPLSQVLLAPVLGSSLNVALVEALERAHSAAVGVGVVDVGPALDEGA